MKKDYKYDIALSFAMEDKEIAEKLSKELNRLEISNYFFPEEDNLALNLKAKTWQVYREESRFAVILISKDYVNKKWATEEREVIQTVNDDRTPYLIPIRIDDTPVPGLLDNIVYKPWESNASYIAISLWRLVKEYREVVRCNNNDESLIKMYDVKEIIRTEVHQVITGNNNTTIGIQNNNSYGRR